MAAGMGRVDAAAVAASGALLAAGAIPQIISGPLGPYLRLDLGISSSELGLGLSLSAIPGVVFSVWGGRLTDRVGGITIGRLTCIVSGLFVVAMSQAPSITWFIGLLAVAGFLRVISEPSSSRILVDLLVRTPRVLAFGIREASLPLLVLVSTAVLPVFGDWLGWRTVFAASSVFAAVGMWLLLGPARPRRPSRAPDGSPAASQPPVYEPPAASGGDVPTLGLSFYGGAGLLMFNLVVFNTFASLSFVDAGSSPDGAAALVAASAGGAVLMRVGCAYAVARRGLNARSTLAAMAAVAVVGYLAMATGNSQWMLVGIPVAYLSGWGWTPLLYSYITVGREQSTGKITGVVSALFASAAIAGPVAAGWVAERFGWLEVWAAAALFSASAAVLMAYRPAGSRSR
ncbi:MAG: MFS transporter [Acidimicrobiaceae bacterium]|nr:MFS transporter [Acidimicrobiaceae bacterium]MXZ67273.1 MFS transporter [Acidimicrobiaceae bacterium]MYF32588.1 MFS transporter [Acidimicrobiaceae bacterium]MYG78671.1 MFS transporter [Acidimicrobiaceae bacterium]MYJ29878.1 MFS transporter [Acidimicrobiaceae bacterium]